MTLPHLDKPNIRRRVDQSRSPNLALKGLFAQLFGGFRPSLCGFPTKIGSHRQEVALIGSLRSSHLQLGSARRPHLKRAYHECPFSLISTFRIIVNDKTQLDTLNLIFFVLNAVPRCSVSG